MTIKKNYYPEKSPEYYLKAFRKILLKDKAVRDYYEKSGKQNIQLPFEQYIEEYLVAIYR